MATDTVYNQYIPRPEGNYVRTPPKWASLAFALRERLNSDLLVLAIDKLFSDAEYKNPTRWEEDGATFLDDNAYAVVIPLIPGDGDVFVVLTKRASDMEADPGHVAFPGGKLEPGENFLTAALREAQEEINLGEKDIGKIVFLDMFERPLSEAQRNSFISLSQSAEAPVMSEGDPSSDMDTKQKVAAFVALLHTIPDFMANRSEVEKIFLLPLGDLLREGLAWDEIWFWENQPSVEINFFSEPNTMGRDLIWGLTARMLTALITLLLTSINL